MGAFFWPKLENSQTEKYFSWKGAEGSIIVMGLIVSIATIDFLKKKTNFRQNQDILNT